MKKMNAKLKKVKWILLSFALIGIGFAGLWWYTNNENSTAEASVSQLKYTVDEVKHGEIIENASGDGMLEAVSMESMDAAYNSIVQKVYKGVGDYAAEGEEIAVLESEEADRLIAEIQDELYEIIEECVTVNKKGDSRYISSVLYGQIKDIKVTEGSDIETVMEEYGYLALISTDGRMQVKIVYSGDISKNQEVSVQIGDEVLTGVVIGMEQNIMTVQIDQNRFAIGETAVVLDADGELLGEGELELSEYVRVTASNGEIGLIAREENDTVYDGSTLFVLDELPKSVEYLELLHRQEEMEAEILKIQSNLIITAAIDGKIIDLPYEEGDEITAGDAVCVLLGEDGFDLTIYIDENYIYNISLEQEASVTFEAISGIYTGRVTYISNAAVYQEENTVYAVNLHVEDIPQALPGMKATAGFVVSRSGDALLVSRTAVHEDDGGSYVYLAPDGSEKDQELAGTEVLNLSLEKVYVETGLMDEDYVVVNGDLEEGSLILVSLWIESTGNDALDAYFKLTNGERWDIIPESQKNESEDGK